MITRLKQYQKMKGVSRNIMADLFYRQAKELLTKKSTDAIVFECGKHSSGLLKRISLVLPGGTYKIEKRAETITLYWLRETEFINLKDFKNEPKLS